MSELKFSAPSAVSIQGVSHRYEDRIALDDVSLSVRPATIFGLLGPNGGGKTTLFRLLTTSLRIQTGSAQIFALDVANKATEVRSRIGVVFQSPSLDKKLKVKENLRHHGRLYGLSGSELSTRTDEMLTRVGLLDRANDLVEKLSGGLARRVELAKGLMHRPDLLIMDEPSTGLDPGARIDFWRYLTQLKSEGVTVLLTTHLMEEAERCDRIAILDSGKVVANGSPAELRSEIGGDLLTIRCSVPEAVAQKIESQLAMKPKLIDGSIRLESIRAFELLTQLGPILGSDVESVSVARPTLEDVFIEKTGHRFWNEAPHA